MPSSPPTSTETKTEASESNDLETKVSAIHKINKQNLITY